MLAELEFIYSLLLSGVAIGLMYSLIALGFVLVYKATDAINFAQGEFVMLAAYFASVTLAAAALPPAVTLVLAILAALVGMVLFSFALERTVLRPLLGRPVVAVIMATIGLAAILRGLPPIMSTRALFVLLALVGAVATLWPLVKGRKVQPWAPITAVIAGAMSFLPNFLIGAQTRALPLPIPDTPIYLGSASIPPIHLLGVVVSIMFLAAFSWFFLKSRMGVAMRAVADNQQVAMAMGINVERYFAIAWAMAGIVSTLGGIIWGSMLGVDTQLALVGLKVFPVVILGGLDSIVGAVVGGLIVGLVESIAAGYLDPYVGGGTKDFAPYVLMIVMLMFKPYGLFGKRKIERI
jgi:branched-chain amino acid transport system permease protein